MTAYVTVIVVNDAYLKELYDICEFLCDFYNNVA